MSRLRAFGITAVFLGLVAYEEGMASALREVEAGLLVTLWAVAVYLNIWWIGNRLPRRVYTLNLWRWRLVLEPNPDQVSRKHPW